MKAKWNCELSLQQLLSDPLVATLMAADRVDADELHEKLKETARDMPRGRGRSRAFSLAECRC